MLSGALPLKLQATEALCISHEPRGLRQPPRVLHTRAVGVLSQEVLRKQLCSLAPPRPSLILAGAHPAPSPARLLPVSLPAPSLPGQQHLGSLVLDFFSACISCVSALLPTSQRGFLPPPSTLLPLVLSSCFLFLLLFFDRVLKFHFSLPIPRWLYQHSSLNRVTHLGSLCAARRDSRQWRHLKF